MIEVYQAYSDLEGMMELTESLVVRLARERLESQNRSTEKLELPYGERMIDYTPPFTRVSYASMFREHVGAEMGDVNAVRRIAGERGLTGLSTKEHDVVVGELFEQLAEPKLGDVNRPVFLYDYPAALCPLTKRKRGEPHIAERFELYIAGMELANAYTELNDPAVQEETFSKQLRGQSEEESMAKMDEDFINALRYGMPPAGGLGVGIDRLVMLMTNRPTIRDVVLFPLLKPTAPVVTEERMKQDVEKLEHDIAPAAAQADLWPIMFVLEKDGTLRIHEIDE
jgi:lysyl-tRNA synthetase, class II